MGESEAEKNEKSVKLEKAAEETGELVGKGLRKTWNAAKSFGKGLVDTLEAKEEPKEASSSTCARCGAPVQSDSNFCAGCGEKRREMPVILY